MCQWTLWYSRYMRPRSLIAADVRQVHNADLYTSGNMILYKWSTLTEKEKSESRKGYFLSFIPGFLNIYLVVISMTLMTFNLVQFLSLLFQITNMLQTLNYALDFVLYFALNVHFRTALKELIWLIIKCPIKCLGKKPEPINLATYRSINTDVTKVGIDKGNEKQTMVWTTSGRQNILF